MYSAPIFRDVRRTSIGMFVGIVAVHAVLKVVFFHKLFLEMVADPLYDATRGYLSHSATAGIIEICVFGVLLVGGARLGARDLGLGSRKLLNGLLVVLFVWSVAQVVVVAIGHAQGGDIYFGPAWNSSREAFVAGTAQAYGTTAFVEELVYRGFLLPQVFLALTAMRRWSWSTCLAIALVSTQLYFALSHGYAAARMDLDLGASLLYLSHVFAVGLLFAALYLRSGNLYVAIGVHGLINFPGGLFESGVDGSLVMLLLSCGLLLSWPALARVMEDVFTVRPGIMQWPAN